MGNKLKLTMAALLATTALGGCFIGCGNDRASRGSVPNVDTSTGSDVGDNTENENNGGVTTEPPQTPVGTEGLEYEKVKENDRVVGYRVIGIGEAKATEIVIPEEYEEKPVTAIGAKAFEDCYKITSVILPETITEIKENAFIGCEKLQFNQFGGIKYLGTADSPFFAAIELVNKQTPSCTIHAQTKVSAKNAFMGCSSLNNVYYSGASVADWCNIDFSGDFANPLSMKTNFYINNTRVNDLVIPEAVTRIKSYAFGSMVVKSITLPTTVTDIGYAAFSSVSGLTNAVVIPSSVTHIDSFAFAFMEGDYDIRLNAASVVVEKNAFSHCEGVKNLYISGEDVDIGTEAFSGCTANRLSVTGGYVKIGLSSFKYADLTSVIFNNSATELDEFAFSYCSKLSYAEFDQLISLGSYVFNDCDHLSQIKYNGSKADWESVDKDRSWVDRGQTLTIKCSDGNVIERR